MRLLLFFIWALYSIIFYLFHLLSIGEEIIFIWQKNIEFSSISWNFLLESILFLVIWILFVIFFTPLKKGSKNISQISLGRFLFYIALFIPLILWSFFINKKIIILLISFVFSDILFSFISNFKDFAKNKIKIRTIWLILNYILTLFLILNIYYFNFSYYIFLMLFYSLFFNFYIYKEYKNYMSLFIFIIILFFIFFNLFLNLQKLYILLS